MYPLYGVRRGKSSAALSTPGRDASCRKMPRAPERMSRRHFAATAISLSDFKIQRTDGAIRNIRGVAQIIRDADGKPVRMIGINRDVTDLINAERSAFRANEAVQTAQEELAQVARLTTMGELAASIAHEISQPLAAVVSYGNGAC